MKSFYQYFLTESISIKKIESQLRTHFISYRKTNSIDDEFDFTIAIEKIVNRVASLVLDNISVSFVTVKIEDKKNSGSFAFYPMNPKVYFQFNLDRNDVIKIINDDNKQSLDKILQILSHEIIHAIQFDRSNTKSTPLSKKHKKYNGNIQYYGSPEEIEAYAANAVQELEQDANIDLKQVLKSLSASSKYQQTHILKYLSSQSTSFKTYNSMFGEATNSELKNIFKRFMKKFIYHINDRIRK